MEQNVDLEDISMINNVGSVTEEGPHLSDCEEASLVDNEDQTNTPTESCSGVPEPTNSYLSDSVPPEKNVVEDGGDDITVIKATVSSIYIDDGVLNMEKPMSTVEQKPTRMTMAQRATMEALASFGGCGLSSISVKKIDLRTELEKDKEKTKRKRSQESEELSPVRKRPRTRLQVSQQEAQKVFENITLADGRKKYSTVQRLKASSSQLSQRSTAKARVTRAEKSKREALESFGGASLDSLSAKPNDTDSANFQSEKTSTCSGRHLTRVERARLEALQAFGGSGLQDVMTSSKRKVACNLEEKNDVAAEDSDSQIGNKENFDGCGEQVPVQ